MVRRSIGWLVGSMICCLIERLVGSLVSKSADRLVCLLSELSNTWLIVIVLSELLGYNLAYCHYCT